MDCFASLAMKLAELFRKYPAAAMVDQFPTKIRAGVDG
jgi:hypothetical protein